MDNEKLREYIELKNQEAEIKKKIKEIEKTELKGKVKETLFFADLGYKITYVAPKEKAEVRVADFFKALKAEGKEYSFPKYCSVSLASLDKFYREDDCVGFPYREADFIDIKDNAISESFRVTKMDKNELREHEE